VPAQQAQLKVGERVVSSLYMLGAVKVGLVLSVTFMCRLTALTT
jgi:hypothetical protein